MAEQYPLAEILDEQERIFKVWGSVDVIDRAGERIPMDELKKVMPILFKRGADVMDSHSNKKVGKWINYEFTEKEGKPGILLTGIIGKDYKLDDVVWDKIKTGDYSGSSFGGASLKEEWGTYKGNPERILRDLEGYEFSVVKAPCNPEATMESINYVAKGSNACKDSKDGGNQMDKKKQEETQETIPDVSAMEEILQLLREMKSMMEAKPMEEKEEEETVPEEPVEETQKQGEKDGIGAKPVNPSPEGGDVKLPESASDKVDEKGKTPTEEKDKVVLMEKNLMKDIQEIKKSLVNKTVTPRPEFSDVKKKEDKDLGFEIAKGLKSMNWAELNNEIKDANFQRAVDAHNAFLEFKKSRGGAQ